LEKVLVTGATGRIGANLCKRLLAKGYKVRGYVMPGDPQEKKLKGLDVEVVYGDLLSPDLLDKAMEGVDAVAHLAAPFTAVGPLDRAALTRSVYFDMNVKGTFYALEAAVKRRDRIEKFLFASSDATYPVPSRATFVIDENYPQRAGPGYGGWKALGERLGEQYFREYGLPFTVVRFGIVCAAEEMINFLKGSGKYWGLGTDGSALIARSGPDGTPWKVMFQDVRDTADGAILALEKKESTGEAFHVHGPGPTVLKVACEYASKVTGLSVVERNVGSLLYYEISINKAKQVLGYQPKYDAFKMIDDSVAYTQGKDIGVIPS
jgi:UDP-glucose 4-epimerase